MINKIDSEMFAFIIYDTKKNLIFAARDPLGVKPLYYAFDKTKQIYFASEAKQLADFDDILEINVFPPAHYFINGKLKRYSKIKTSNKFSEEKEITRLLEEKVVEAVKKRVQTDLPVGVFLSGGVDSSLVMEIATRFHPDVTAIILGYPGSPDYEFALRLCKERGYKHHIVRPYENYEKELDRLIYHLETYEPLIIRQSFPGDICAREAHRLGLRVVLVGEGADELFGGYNEFASLPPHLINKGCEKLVSSLHAGHLQRVDRTSMKHTVEVRCPFFDKDLVETAFQIDGNLKVKRTNHQITTKYILRKVAESFLPDYIAWRYKVPFSNGAGMNVGSNYKVEDGDVAKAANQKMELSLSDAAVKRYGIHTKEEQYYLSKFEEFRFTKIAGSETRLVVKDNLGDLYKSKNTRLVLAEFDRLAMYFPVYFAAETGVF
jgi:asparagine synthase (glutamine-hydrolysing)